MLCQFSVKNFRCFRDNITLDMQAADISEHNERLLVDSDGERFLPIAAIYGPNGGGKSSTLGAMYCLHQKIMMPVYLSRSGSGTYADMTYGLSNLYSHDIAPFAFSTETQEAPTEFEIFFRTHDAEYRYNINISKGNVVYENLTRLNIGSKKYQPLIGTENQRVIPRGYFKHFNTSSRSKKMPLLSYLFMSYSNPTIDSLFRWFDKKLLFRSYGKPDGETRRFHVLDVEGKMQMMSMFREMDIGISDYRVERLPEQPHRVITVHEVEGKTFELNLSDESDGTNKLFGLMPDVMDSILSGGALVVDELDAKLHPVLLKYIIGLYANPEINKKKAQLIFTSHDLANLNRDNLRRDEVWFVDKNNQKSAGLYSMVEFNSHSENYSDDYLKGKYGADPYLRRFIDWDKAQ